MTRAWYLVASKSLGYAAALIALAVVLLALRSLLAERGLWRRVLRQTPQAGAAGMLRVLSPGGRRLAAGDDIPVPYEGTLGSSHRCDVRVPYRRVHLRSAFFWMEGDALHMVPLHRDGFEADGVSVEPGDEAVLRDGAVLRIGEMRLSLRLSREALGERGGADGPYVTRARRSRAQMGRGEGIGAPGRGEARREERLREHPADERPDRKPKRKRNDSGGKIKKARGKKRAAKRR